MASRVILWVFGPHLLDSLILLETNPLSLPFHVPPCRRIGVSNLEPVWSSRCYGRQKKAVLVTCNLRSIIAWLPKGGGTSEISNYNKMQALTAACFVFQSSRSLKVHYLWEYNRGLIIITRLHLLNIFLLLKTFCFGLFSTESEELQLDRSEF